MDALHAYGEWTAKSGWTAQPDMGYADMRKILERLVIRGLVIKQRRSQPTKQGQKGWCVVYLPKGMK